jgi:hypothetical protein
MTEQADDSDLFPMTLAEILTFWRPGSHDWSWKQEYQDLMGPGHAVTAAVRERVAAEGFGFQDHIAPILLGSDGRVWDGHHRICLAIQQEKHCLNVELDTDRSKIRVN